MKFLYAFLGAVCALLVKTTLDRRRALRGAPPRRFPTDGRPVGASAEDEIEGPLSEV